MIGNIPENWLIGWCPKVDTKSGMEEVGGGSDGIHHALHAQGGSVHRLVDAQRVKIDGEEEVQWVRSGLQLACSENMHRAARVRMCSACTSSNNLNTKYHMLQ